MPHNVFTYGSLMFAPVWSRVVAGAYRQVPARLDGFDRFAVVGELYPGAVPAAGGRLDGMLYLAVDDADVARLDDFEGAEYRRDSVTVVAADGSTHTAETYVYLPVDRLAPAAWVPDAFALDRFLATYVRDHAPR